MKIISEKISLEEIKIIARRPSFALWSS